MFKLKPLEEHNKERTRSMMLDDLECFGLGIACPVCGHELRDATSGSILMSYPAKKRTECSNEECHYVGYCIA